MLKLLWAFTFNTFHMKPALMPLLHTQYSSKMTIIYATEPKEKMHVSETPEEHWPVKEQFMALYLLVMAVEKWLAFTSKSRIIENGLKLLQIYDQNMQIYNLNDFIFCYHNLCFNQFFYISLLINY